MLFIIMTVMMGAFLLLWFLLWFSLELREIPLEWSWIYDIKYLMFFFPRLCFIFGSDCPLHNDNCNYDNTVIPQKPDFRLINFTTAPFSLNSMYAKATSATIIPMRRSGAEADIEVQSSASARRTATPGK